MRRLVVFVPGLLAAALVFAVSAASDLPVAAELVAIAAVVLSLLAGVVPRRRDVRAHAAAALAIAAVTAAGQTNGGVVYTAGAPLFALATVVCMRVARGRVVGDAPPASRRAFAVVVVAGAASAIGLALALPPAERLVAPRVAELFAERGDVAGFSSSMRLGSTRGMLMSDTIVLRVRAPRGVRVDYLRGVAYDRYELREWTSTLDAARRTVHTRTDLDAAPIRVAFARDAPVARRGDARWFLPAGACDLATPSGAIAFDDAAVAHPDGFEWRIDDVSFRLDGCAPPAAPAAPRASDRALPTKIRLQLAPIAAQWTEGATDDRAKVEAISRRLASYGYSLSVKREFARDPVVDFITTHKEGHCEHFASALALLARASGVPARVVSGYRVREEDENAIDGHWVVRERNAHTWVEAFYDGAWHAHDPTPLAEPAARAGTLADLGEALAAYADRLQKRTAAFALAALGALVLVVMRVARAVRKRARRTRRTAPDPPLPSYAALESALAAAGHARDAAEPLERFAARVAASAAPWADEAARAVVEYAALRYGGEGDRTRVERSLDEAARRVARA